MADNPKKVGVVIHYYPKIGVGIIKADEEIKVGDKVQFKGKATNFKQEISEMQFDHQPIQSAVKNQEVGMKLDKKVREKDELFRVE
jgi:hypothetical protein